MILRLASMALLIAFCIAFFWPLIDPYLIRHDASTRILDRLEEEWEREVDPTTDERRWDW